MDNPDAERRFGGATGLPVPLSLPMLALKGSEARGRDPPQ
jgi:hypothetical protein